MKIMLQMPCPECVREGKVVPKEYWKHGGSCNGFLFLDDNGIVSCSRCNKTAKISEMKLTCDCGSHTLVFPSIKGFAKAISMSGKLVSKHEVKWLRQVLAKF